MSALLYAVIIVIGLIILFAVVLGGGLFVNVMKDKDSRRGGCLAPIIIVAGTVIGIYVGISIGGPGGGVVLVVIVLFAWIFGVTYGKYQ